MRSVVTTFRVLETVAEQQPVGLSELARVLGLPKTTVQRSLSVLGELGWIAAAPHSEQTRWILTTRALTIGGRVSGVTHLRAAALPVMQQLSRATEETIHLTVPEGPSVVLIDKVDSTREVRTVTWIGGHVPMHASSSGKAMLSRMSEAEVRALLGDRLERSTDRTVTDLGALLAELDVVRKRGWAVNVGGWRDDVSAVGAPVLDVDGRPVAALSISTPSHRLPEDIRPHYGELVRDAAAQATRNLEAPPALTPPRRPSATPLPP